MADEVLQALSILLPLKIDRVIWDGDILILQSAVWNFRTQSAWRVCKNGKLIFACWDMKSYDHISELLDLSIVEVDWLVGAQPIDPLFKLSDGSILSVFCSSSTEPWLMEFSGGAVYLGGA